MEAQASGQRRSTAERRSRERSGGNGQTPARPEILAGPVHAGVFRVALPSVATMLLQTANGWLDRFFVGSLGSKALAALTVSLSLRFALMSAAMAISVGTTALVARSIGEGRPEEAERAARQSLLLAGAIGVAVALLTALFLRPLLLLLGLEPSTLHLATSYLGIVLPGLPVLFTMLILNGTFRGMGDTVHPFWVSLGANGVHILGAWLLVYGIGPFPRMGLPGGSAALFLSDVVALSLYLFFLRRSPLRGALRRGGWRLDGHWARRIARIGLPASAQQLLRVGSMLAFQGILARTGGGSAAVAALGVGLVSESIAFMPGFGYSIAASAFVGQNLGARQVRRAHNGALAATAQALLIMTVMGVVFWTFAEPFARLFVHGKPASPAERAEIARTIAFTVSYLKISAWTEPLLGLSMVLTGALQGAGETRSPTIITVLTMLGVRLPLAWLLAAVFDLGTVGAWYAMAASTAAQGLLTLWVFRRGTWRRVRV